MSGQQPPPYPGPYGDQPSEQPPQDPQPPSQDPEHPQQQDPRQPSGQPPPGPQPPGPQPPPYPGPPPSPGPQSPPGPQPPGPQSPPHGPPQPPPYPGPPPSQQPPPYPGQYGQQSPYGQQQPYPSPYPQQPYPGQPYPGQQYPGQPYPAQPYRGYPPQPGYPPAAKEPTDSTARTIGGVIAATGLLVAIAAFLTWGTIEGLGQSYDINGVTGSDFPGDNDLRDGVLTLILAIPVIGFAIARAVGQLSLTAAIIGTVAGALVVLIAIVDIADISNTGDELAGGGVNLDTTVGVGLWLTLLGGIAMSLASIIGIIKRR